MDPITAYFYDATNNIIERIEASPPSFGLLELDVVSPEFKPTTTHSVVISGDYGPETVFPGIGVKLFQSGGGLQRITVPYHARRYSRGDAEWYCYRMLRHLGRSGLGDLVINDHAYTNCYFVAGDGEIVPAWERFPEDVAQSSTQRRARFHVKGSLHFIRGLPSDSELGSASAPAPYELAASATGTNLGNYIAVGAPPETGGGAIKLGRYCDLTNISCDRTYTATKIPRCFGVRIKDRGHSVRAIATTNDYIRGRKFTFGFRAYQWAAVDVYGIPTPIPVVSQSQFNPSRFNLEQKIQTLHLLLRDRMLNLAGNGCVFYDCLLQSLSIDEDPTAFSCLGYNLSFAHTYQEIDFL